MDTPLGLRRTAELIEVNSGQNDRTVWTRHWEDERLILDASGSFLDDGSWYPYNERIEKLMLSAVEVADWCVSAGMQSPAWRSDDLLTSLEDPESGSTAYGVIRAPAVT